MPTRPIVPKHALNAFHALQAELGGGFHRPINLNPRVYNAVNYVVDKQNRLDHITRVMLVGEGFILIHKHHNIEEYFEIIKLFNDAYGHVFYPSHHRFHLEKVCGKLFHFQRNELHGLSVLRGFALIKVEIFGEFDPSDVHTHI